MPTFTNRLDCCRSATLGQAMSNFTDCVANPSKYGCQDIPISSNPIPPIFTTQTTNSTTSSVSNGTIYQFALAAIVLYLLMRYIPGGLWIGLILLAGSILASPKASQDYASFLNFIQTGVSSL